MSLYLFAGAFAALVLALLITALLAARAETTEGVVKLSAHRRIVRDRPVIQHRSPH